LVRVFLSGFPVLLLALPLVSLVMLVFGALHNNPGCLSEWCGLISLFQPELLIDVN
jgi:hypothetical protein